AGAVDLRQRRPGNFCTDLFLERIAFGEADHCRIFAGGAQGTLLNQSVRVFVREIRPLTRFQVLLGIVNLSYRGCLGHRSHLNFSDLLALLIIGSVQDGRRVAISDDQLHAFGKTIIASAVQVNDSIRDIFHLECHTNANIGLVSDPSLNRRVQFGGGGRRWGRSGGHTVVGRRRGAAGRGGGRRLIRGAAGRGGGPRLIRGAAGRGGGPRLIRGAAGRGGGPRLIRGAAGRGGGPRLIRGAAGRGGGPRLIRGAAGRGGGPRLIRGKFERWKSMRRSHRFRSRRCGQVLHSFLSSPMYPSEYGLDGAWNRAAFPLVLPPWTGWRQHRQNNFVALGGQPIRVFLIESDDNGGRGSARVIYHQANGLHTIATDIYELMVGPWHRARQLEQKSTRLAHYHQAGSNRRADGDLHPHFVLAFR